MSLKVWELLINLSLDQLCVRLVFLDANESIRVCLKGWRDLDGILDSCSWKLAQIVNASMEHYSLCGFWLFKLLEFVCFSNQVFKDRRSHKVIDSVGVGSLELDRPRWSVAIKDSPLISYCSICLKYGSIKLDQCLLNDRHIFSLPSLNIHHCGKWTASSNPVFVISII